MIEENIEEDLTAVYEIPKKENVWSQENSEISQT